DWNLNRDCLNVKAAQTILAAAFVANGFANRNAIKNESQIRKKRIVRLASEYPDTIGKRVNTAFKQRCVRGSRDVSNKRRRSHQARTQGRASPVFYLCNVVRLRKIVRAAVQAADPGQKAKESAAVLDGVAETKFVNDILYRILIVIDLDRVFGIFIKPVPIRTGIWFFQRIIARDKCYGTRIIRTPKRVKIRSVYARNPADSRSLGMARCKYAELAKHRHQT